MTTLPLYQVDAFAEQPFAGNPAAVCPLEGWFPDATLQAIAAENNLAETAFLVPAGAGGVDYELRWFTPTVEVDLCGHATLASGFVLMNCLGHERDNVRFSSRSGPLSVARDADRFVLDFPAHPPQPVADPTLYAEALGAKPEAVLGEGMALAVFADADSVAALTPDMNRTAALGGVGVIASARGQDCDFVSRFFAPQSGIPEDPVTGSAHCVLSPYWAERLGKNELTARQISKRGGHLVCRVEGDRVKIGGRCQLYLEGRIHV